MKDLIVWDAIDSESYRNKLEQMFKMMGVVDKKVDEVIDRKRG